jgi:hypothetical protein
MLVVEFKHRLPAEDAKSRITALGDYLQNKYGIHASWQGDKLCIRGRYAVLSVEGTVTLLQGLVRMEGTDPGFLLRGKAKEYLHKKLSLYLDPNVALDNLPRR